MHTVGGILVAAGFVLALWLRWNQSRWTMAQVVGLGLFDVALLIVGGLLYTRT